MKFFAKVGLAAIAAASFSVMAATDGVADATQSVGSFTNTFGASASPQIRVFGLQDAVMTSNAVTVGSAFGAAPGDDDSFCVAHSTGASVTLRFTSAGLSAAGSSNSAIATDASTGDTLVYHQSVAINGDPTSYKAIGATDNSFVVSAPQTSLTDCSSPQVYKTIIRANSLQGPTNGVYTDLVTVTATLN